MSPREVKGMEYKSSTSPHATLVAGPVEAEIKSAGKPRVVNELTGRQLVSGRHCTGKRPRPQIFALEIATVGQSKNDGERSCSGFCDGDGWCVQRVCWLRVPAVQVHVLARAWKSKCCR